MSAMFAFNLFIILSGIQRKLMLLEVERVLHLISNGKISLASRHAR